MSHFKASGELKKSAPVYFAITPDVDNVTKFVLDALQPAVLKDDKFVVLCNGFHRGEYCGTPQVP